MIDYYKISLTPLLKNDIFKLFDLLDNNKINYDLKDDDDLTIIFKTSYIINDRELINKLFNENISYESININELKLFKDEVINFLCSNKLIKVEDDGRVLISTNIFNQAIDNNYSLHSYRILPKYFKYMFSMEHSVDLRCVSDPKEFFSCLDLINLDNIYLIVDGLRLGCFSCNRILENYLSTALRGVISVRTRVSMSDIYHRFTDK